MKFSLQTLVGAVLVAGLTMGSMIESQGYSYVAYRLLTLTAFLAALVHALSSTTERRWFSRGWALCGGVTLTLIILRIPLLAHYISEEILRRDPFSDYDIRLRGIDLAFSNMAAYLGGVWCVYLRRNEDDSRQQ